MSRFGTELHIPPLLPLDISAGPLLSAQQSPDGKSAAISWSGPSYEWIKALLLASGSCMLSVRQEQKKSRESHPRERTRQSKLFPPSPSPSPPSSPSSYHRPLASLPHSIYVILSLTDPSIQESIDELSPWADLWLATTRPLLPHMSDVDLHRCAIAMRCLLLPLFSERSNLSSWLDAFKQAALHQLPKMGASQIRSLALLLSATENELSAEWRTALDESRLRVITLSREA